MKAKCKRWPSRKYLLNSINASDPLHMVMRSHQCLEKVMTIAILETLPFPHSLEVNRLSFPLKTDLSVALRIIVNSSRPLFIKINRIRNIFAHNPEAILSTRVIKDLWNCLSNRQRRCVKQKLSDFNDHFDVFRTCIAIAFLEIEVYVGARRDSQIRAKVLHEMVNEVLDKSPNRIQVRKKYKTKREALIENHVSKERARRLKRGEP